MDGIEEKHNWEGWVVSEIRAPMVKEFNSGYALSVFRVHCHAGWTLVTVGGLSKGRENSLCRILRGMLNVASDVRLISLFLFLANASVKLRLNLVDL